MSKKALDTLTETMFYVLLALKRENMCGSEITEYVSSLTKGRVVMGPGTLYTILSNFQKEKLVEHASSKGRMIIYTITEKGELIYNEELKRLKKLVSDAEKGSG